MRSNMMNECKGPRQKRRGAHFKPEVITGEAAIALLLSPEFHFSRQRLVTWNAPGALVPGFGSTLYTQSASLGSALNHKLVGGGWDNSECTLQDLLLFPRSDLWWLTKSTGLRIFNGFILILPHLPIHSLSKDLLSLKSFSQGGTHSKTVKKVF